MSHSLSYSLFPLGDSALIIDFGNVIDENVNREVLRLFHHLQSIHHPFILDLVPAYSSLAVYYDIASIYQNEKTAFEVMVDEIGSIFSQKQNIPEMKPSHFDIPVCYSKKFGIDLCEVSRQKEISIEDIIKIHTSKIYRVYMLGFMPGFSYMGEVDDRITIERKPVPVKLFAGAVGIAGKQTGIYPVPSPGGWQIIGRTPVKIFTKENEQPVLFQPGDEVKFYSITEHEFANY